MPSDETSRDGGHAGRVHAQDPSNLQAVRGIGPKAEGCLKNAGIKDLGQLARTPVNELAAAVTGLRGKFDSDRITGERWIAQAAALAARAGSSGPNGEAELAQPIRHSFTVEVRLPLPDRDVVSTKVVHVHTGDEEIWAGWHPPRVIAFIEDRSGICAGARPAEQPAAELTERPGAQSTEQPGAHVTEQPGTAQHPRPVKPPRAKPRPTANGSPGRQTQLCASATVPASGQGAVGGRTSAVTGTLIFDPAPLSLAAHQTAMAQVEVFARQLLTGSSVAVGSRSATVHPEQQVRVEVSCDLSRPSRPFVLFALVRVLVQDGEARRPAKELAGVRLSVAPAGCHRPMATLGIASFRVTA
jgi:hypothetical protein